MTKKTGEFYKSPMMEDVNMVLEDGDKDQLLKLTAIFHTEKEDFRAISVLSFENMRDYYKETGESFSLTVMMGLGDYTYRLIPFAENLEVSVVETFHDEAGIKSKTKKPRETRYKVLIDPNANTNVHGDQLANTSIKDLNLSGPITVGFELVDRYEEKFRLLQIDGVFNNTPDELLVGCFIDAGKKIKVDGKPILSAVDMDKPDNKDVYKNLLVPSKIFLRDLPGWLQENSKGVYAAGIGSFFQTFEKKPTWFNYPLYKPERFDEDKRKLVIMAVPENKLPSSERTYRTEGKVTYILSTGSKKIVQTARNRELNTGIGFRMADAEAFMNKPVEIKEDGIKAVRNRLNYELADYQRRDKVGYAPVYKSSSTPFIQISRVLANRFSAVSISWENSDPSLLYPGMPVKYCYMDRGKYKEMKGTLAKVFSVSSVQNNPMTDGYCRRTTQMVILAEAPEDFPDNEPEKELSGYQ